MQMEKTQQKKDVVLTDVVEKVGSIEVGSNSPDNQSINVELELSKNVNKLMDRLEENDELKHILSDREQNKLISQKSLDLLRSRQAIQEADFVAYDGTVENLLELAKKNDVIARAIEINPEKMIEQFEKINYRYALLKEHPDNHASLIHFEFGVPLPEVSKKVAAEKKRIADFCKSEPTNFRERRSEKKRLKNKPEYNANKMKTHKLRLDSLLMHSKNAANVSHCPHDVSYSNNVMYLRTAYNIYVSFGSFVAIRFDQFAKIKLMELTPEEKTDVSLLGN